jgi:hypothetical protein
VTTVEGLHALGDLDVVLLGDLTAEAELQTRCDRKYLVPRLRVDDLVADVAETGAVGPRVLVVDGARSFRYESVYFDTTDLVSYLGAARRRPQRFKVRTRSYLDSGACMLEVKTRDARGRTVKHRQPHDLARRTEVTPEGRSFVASVGPAAAAVDDLRPTLTTAYRRATLVLDGARARVTIDVDLTWEHPGGSRVDLPDHALVETKTCGPPSAFDRVLWRARHRPVTISKYCTGLAALVPDLPANKWNRVLREHFGRGTGVPATP